MLFEEHHYGSPISEELSEIIRRYTTSRDIAEVARNEKAGTSTIRDVLYYRNSLTKKNADAIIEMAKIAFHNCMNQRKQTEKDAEFFAKEIKVQ